MRLKGYVVAPCGLLSPTEDSTLTDWSWSVMGMWDVEQINDNVEQEMTQSDVGRYRDQV